MHLGNRGQWFHGRERLTATLVARLAEQIEVGGPLVVVGPSGVGKSSLLRAGLLPALERGGLPVEGSAQWPWLLMTPGSAPLAELAVRVALLAGEPVEPAVASLRADPEGFPAVIRAAKRAAAPAPPDPAPPDPAPPDPDGAPASRWLVVVVDQFEELFTQCRDEAERVAVVAALCAAAADPAGPAALVVLGVRADFYDRCAAYPLLRPCLQDRQLLVGPMSEAEVRAAIRRPAEDAGMRVEPALVEVLLRDLGIPAPDSGGGQASGSYPAGALPLLAHALRETWDRRAGDTLTLAGYSDTGGLGGSVAAAAEAAYRKLGEGERGMLRQVMLRRRAPRCGGERGPAAHPPAAAAGRGAGRRRRDVGGPRAASGSQRERPAGRGRPRTGHRGRGAADRALPPACRAGRRHPPAQAERRDGVGPRRVAGRAHCAGPRRPAVDPAGGLPG